MLPFEHVKREVIVKNNAETSVKFGKNPADRTAKELLNFGIINLDKPDGPSSHQVCAYLQQALHIKKAGHSGTLDPGVTGVLPTALGRSTKVVQMLLTAGKEYVAVMHIHADIQEHKVRETIEQFVGKITQLPPVRSAVKRQLRERTIYYVQILEVEGRDVLFRVGCEAGTYIRKLCFDIGKQLGCGAHMAELRRTKVGPFNESTLVTLQEAADAYWYFKEQGNEKYLRKIIQPMENGAAHLPHIWIMDAAVDSVSHGATIHLPGIAKFETGIAAGELAAVCTLKGELICYGRAQMSSEEMKEKDKGSVLKPLRVFMDTGIYPKMDKASSKLFP